MSNRKNDINRTQKLILATMKVEDISSLLQGYPDDQLECTFPLIKTLDDKMLAMAVEYSDTAWAACHVPPWAAVAIRATFKPGKIPPDCFLLEVHCGLDDRRHPSTYQIEEAYEAVAKRRLIITEKEVMDIAKKLDRNPKPLLDGEPITRERVIEWASKSLYIPFLRSVFARLGKWISQHPECRYYKAYCDKLAEEDEDASLAQLKARAQVSAARAYLREYYSLLSETDKRPFITKDANKLPEPDEKVASNG